MNANYADFGDARPAPQRTSVLAILCLIFGIICVPGFGILGLFFGVGAIVAINASRGRVSGLGLAITGIVFSLIASVLWIGLGLGMMQAKNVVEQQIDELIVAAYAADVDAAKEILNDKADAAITAEMCTAFTTAVDARVGKWSGFPEGFFKFFGRFGKLAPAQQQAEAQGYLAGGTAWPGEFANGPALLIIQFDTVTPGEWLKGEISNLGVMTNDGKVDWLIPQTP